MYNVHLRPTLSKSHVNLGIYFMYTSGISKIHLRYIFGIFQSRSNESVRLIYPQVPSTLIYVHEIFYGCISSSMTHKITDEKTNKQTRILINPIF